MRIVHKVCTMLKKHESMHRNKKFDAPCEQCPASQAFGKNGQFKGTRGCRVMAEEVVNLVKFGNPWGEKYRRSRRSWPDRDGYTDKHSRARRTSTTGAGK